MARRRRRLRVAHRRQMQRRIAREYYYANKERCLANQRRWQAAHRDVMARLAKEYRQRNRKRLLAHARWLAANKPWLRSWYNARARAKKYGIPFDLKIEEFSNLWLMANREGMPIKNRIFKVKEPAVGYRYDNCEFVTRKSVLQQAWAVALPSQGAVQAAPLVKEDPNEKRILVVRNDDDDGGLRICATGDSQLQEPGEPQAGEDSSESQYE